MKTTKILERVAALQRTLAQLEQPLARIADKPIKEQPPPDDDWSPNGLATVHLDYLSESLHRLADALQKMATNQDDSPSGPGDDQQPADDDWGPGDRALADLGYIVMILDQLALAMDEKTEASTESGSATGE